MGGKGAKRPATGSRYVSDDGRHFRARWDNTAKGSAHRRFTMSINLNDDDFGCGELSFLEHGPRGFKTPIGDAGAFPGAPSARLRDASASTGPSIAASSSETRQNSHRSNNLADVRPHCSFGVHHDDETLGAT